MNDNDRDDDKDIEDLVFGNDSDVPSSELINDLSEEENRLPMNWIDNNGEEVEEVFGFNENAELVNGRAAMVGFIMMIITELILGGDPVTHSIFGIG